MWGSDRQSRYYQGLNGTDQSYQEYLERRAFWEKHIREEALEHLYDELRDAKYVGDYVIDNLYLGKRDNPAHSHAISKVSFFMKALQEDELNEKYGDILKKGKGGRLGLDTRRKPKNSKKAMQCE